MIRLIIVTGIVVMVAMVAGAIALYAYGKYRRRGKRRNGEFENYPEN